MDQNYNLLLSSFVDASSSDSAILSRVLLEAPIITEQVLVQLCSICQDENRCSSAMALLKELIFKRPTRQKLFLKVLLSNTTHDSNIIRENAIIHVIELYNHKETRADIEDFVVRHLNILRSAQPPEELFGRSQGRTTVVNNWNDDVVKACLQVYISLLPINEALIHELAKVYIVTGADVKRTILRLLETPVRMMGMESVELLKLVEECPKGSETLVTRVIHILTDKGAPSSQLVQRVRDLYNSRISDVRFLIPVLNGLTKKEVKF